MQRSCPFANAGLSKLDASITLPCVLPAPIMVWISSINNSALGMVANAFNTAFTRASKSPRYFAPASSAPISSEYTCAFANTSGTWFCSIKYAKPSANAVLPTPASPTSKGLFLRRRHNTCSIRSISAARPINGSMRSAFTSALRWMV